MPRVFKAAIGESPKGYVTRIFPCLAAFKEYNTVGLPALEVYHAAKISVRFALNHTDICLPMRRKSGT